MSKPFLIKNATIVQEGHSRHLKRSDILINNGIIEKIGNQIKADAKLIEGKALRVCIGWHDMRCHLADPGFEYKEDLFQLSAAAAAGGFTSLSTLPDSEPVIDHKSALQYILNKTDKGLTAFYPYGTVSENGKGTQLAELYDMHQNGAVAFTDGDSNLSSGLLKKALLYVQSFDGLILSTPLDPSLHQDGMVNESEHTVSTGLKASPSVAEFSQLRQQLDVLAYTGGRMHVSGISTKESVALIKEAKKKGLNVTCDVAIYNLCFTDEATQGFETDFKCLPILRTETDRKALIKGVKEGVIDAIVSNHHAQNVELKKVEFDYAAVGSITLQAVYALYLKYLQKDLDEATFMACLTTKPREILQLPGKSLEVGSEADLVVFDQGAEWQLDQKSNRSGSRNTHLWNSKLTGRAIAVFRGKNNQLL